MISVYLSTAAALVIAGVAAGILAVVSLGVRREERRLSMKRAIADPAARGARRVNGLYTRGPGLAYQPAADSALGLPK